MSLSMIAHQTLTVEIAPRERLPTYYLSILGVTVVPFMLGVAPLGGLVWSLGKSHFGGHIWPVAAVSGVMTGIAFVLMLAVKEPRFEQAEILPPLKRR